MRCQLISIWIEAQQDSPPAWPQEAYRPRPLPFSKKKKKLKKKKLKKKKLKKKYISKKNLKKKKFKKRRKKKKKKKNWGGGVGGGGQHNLRRTTVRRAVIMEWIVYWELWIFKGRYMKPFREINLLWVMYN